jgi:hypothetical protein
MGVFGRRDRRREILEEFHIDRVDRIVGPIDDDPRDPGGVRRDKCDGAPWLCRRRRDSLRRM